MKIKARTLWWMIVGSSLVGLVASLIQTIERINYALHPAAPLSCNINAIFSCSNVFDAWQSRVFGFSNSLVCMIFFALTGGLALAAAMGGVINIRLRQIFHFFAVFFLGFGAWYLWQSTFRISYICIFCLFCYSAVIAMNWAWWRLYYQDSRWAKLAKSSVAQFFDNGGDIYAAIIWTFLIAGMIIAHFR